MKMQATPQTHLPCVLRSTGHTISISVIKNKVMGFVCAAMEVCGYSYGDIVSIYKLRCWNEGDFVFFLNMAMTLKFQPVTVVSINQYKY